MNVEPEAVASSRVVPDLPVGISMSELEFEGSTLVSIRGVRPEHMDGDALVRTLKEVAALAAEKASQEELPLSAKEVSDIAYYVEAVHPSQMQWRAAREAVAKLKSVPAFSRRRITSEMIDAFKVAFHASYDGGKGEGDYDKNIRIGLEAAVCAKTSPSQVEGVLDELERLARAANPAPHHIYTFPRDDINWKANADFHAMASPDLVLSLITNIRSAPATDIPPDVFSVHDGGNAITVHFSEIKSARAFRDSFPVAIVAEMPFRLIGPEDDWRADPAQDERWNAGFDFATLQLCNVLGIDPETVTWDVATETLEGDARAVLANILRRRLGDGLNPAALSPMTSVETDDPYLRKDAERFRALMRCGRIKMQGSSGVDPRTGERNGNNVHFGAEFWPEPIPEGFEEHYEASTKWGRACIKALADAIIEDEEKRAAGKEAPK